MITDRLNHGHLDAVDQVQAEVALGRLDGAEADLANRDGEGTEGQVEKDNPDEESESVMLDTRHDREDEDCDEEDGIADARHNVQHLHLVRVIIEVCVLLIADE